MAACSLLWQTLFLRVSSLFRQDRDKLMWTTQHSMVDMFSTWLGSCVPLHLPRERVSLEIVRSLYFTVANFIPVGEFSFPARQRQTHMDTPAHHSLYGLYMFRIFCPITSSKGDLFLWVSSLFRKTETNSRGHPHTP